jgi:hypothetical protein
MVFYFIFEIFALGGVRVSRFGFGRRHFACGQNNIDENYSMMMKRSSEVK